MALIDAGAGAFAGLFYRLAENYSGSLLETLTGDAKRAVALVADLQKADAPWLKGTRRKTISIRDLRDSLVSDSHLTDPAIESMLQSIKWPAPRQDFETRQLEINSCIRHGDLHCENVFASADRPPLLIDFGKVGPGPAALDPITLELGLAFHPAAQVLRGKWPSASEASQWTDWSHQPSRDCPVRDFILRCREWRDTVAAGPREILATYYGLLMRQLRFPDTDKAAALSILQSVVSALDQTYA
jgi:hypothetical protein